LITKGWKKFQLDQFRLQQPRKIENKMGEKKIRKRPD